ncbi:ubiquinone biosynthesis protein UbiB [Leeia sp. TBRC 13508]|uniref:Ubiquinone biosynthesis protein UbiB n=1 Tax=Leeia speluncae TaxID=2884804 RepID=A0ABS8D8D5_9NEIS|nr:AarF/UbiB family protein [Leeia speluncae]MCB6184464.1 ubiquinone biosynthesis protein UbiB [Leeia speluncae]
MLRETLSAMRDLPRLREVSTILIRYGMGDFLRKLGVTSALERAGQFLHIPTKSDTPHLEAPVRLRKALEELGPTFVKLGQVLATRADLFSEDWILEFEKLQSHVPSVPYEHLQEELTKALGASPEHVFSFFDPTPIGSGSIAQVHLAKLQNGTDVVVKIRRPNIRPKIDADLRILGYMAQLIELEFPEVRRYRPQQIVEQFAKSLKRELDLAAEARNMERFAKNFAIDETVKVPRVHWELTSESVNVQDLIIGIPGNHLQEIEVNGLDRKILASRGADAVLKMILIDGYFHADPHPGNVFYLPDNQIAFIDFGMVGWLSKQRRDQIVDLLAALASRDAYSIADVLQEWVDGGGVDDELLAGDISEFIFNYEHVALKDIRISTLLGDIVTIMRDHGIALPADMTLLFKALITLEGLGRQLDPNFRMVEHLTPFVKQVIIARYKPEALWQKGKHGLKEVAGLLSGLPKDIAKLVKEIRRGNVKIDLDLKRLDHFGHQLDKSANRLTLGIVTAALIIGSSIAMTVPGGPKTLGFFAFIIAMLNSMWIVFSIWRSGKH